MTVLRRLALAALAAPLVLALAACGSKEEATSQAPAGEPIAHVAPPAGSSWSETVAVTPEDGYRIGNPEAPLKVVEYASLTCSHCAHFAEMGSAAMDNYVDTGVVSYEIRNQIHDAVDLSMATILRCAPPESFHPLAEQIWANLGTIFDTFDKNKEAMDAAMADQGPDRFQKVARAAGLLDFFAARGIAKDQSLQCLSDVAKPTAILDRSKKQSDELGVQGTPTFFLNGKKLDNLASWESVGSNQGLEAVLQNAGAR
jgi:protein-disulfide isomerase